MKLKNYTTGQNIDQIIAKLQSILGSHGAKRISFDYNNANELSGISFAISVKDNLVDIKLPCKIEKVEALLKHQYETGQISSKRGREKTYGHEQAVRVGWANILLWVEAQMAFIDIEQVKMEQVFLPYVTNRSGLTLYEVFSQDEFRHLPELASGSAEVGEVVA